MFGDEHPWPTAQKRGNFHCPDGKKNNTKISGRKNAKRKEPKSPVNIYRSFFCYNIFLFHFH